MCLEIHKNEKNMIRLVAHLVEILDDFLVLDSHFDEEEVLRKSTWILRIYFLSLVEVKDRVRGIMDFRNLIFENCLETQKDKHSESQKW